MRVPFIGGANQSRSINVSTQRAVNWVPQMDPSSKYQAAMYGRPGLASFAATGAAEVRGAIVFSDALFVVVGSELKSISTSGTVTSRGTLTTSASGPVGMAANATQILIVDGVDGYVWNGTTLAVIADADFPNTSTHAAFIDGYFVVNDTANAGRFYISASNDGTDWTSTDFATAERAPDDLVALIVDHRELWLFGEETTEVWYNSGATFPFQQIPGGFTEWGCQAKYSVAANNGAVYWLAKGKHGGNVVMKSQGYRGVRISTHAIEERIAALSTTTDAIGWAMESRGHFWYVLVFPAGLTVVYDETTGLWHEWKSYGLERFRGNCHAYFNNKHYIGDYQDGNVFELDWDTYSDAGQPIECIREDRHMADQSMRGMLFHRRFEIEFEAGVGLATGQGSDPQAMLQWSDDGGHTWSNEHWRSIGAVGKYTQRAIWRSLGRSRDRVYRVTVTDPVKRVLVSGFADIDTGAP